MFGEGLDELLEFEGGGGVVGASPGEEPEGFGRGSVAGAENTVHELGGEGDVESVEGAFWVNVVPDYVGDVVYGGEVIVF